jgi:CheY-like chemotaxis protein
VALVLTDVEMPEMDGYILTKRIKTDPRFEGVPVIMHRPCPACPTSMLVARSAWMSMWRSSNLNAWQKYCAA